MLTLWNGFDRTLADELRRMDRMFTRRPSFGAMTWPRVNVTESEAALEVSADVPGFTSENVHVSVHDGVLTIEGQVAEEAKKDDDKVHYSERRNMSFKRTFRLNLDVDVEKAVANVKDGVLTVSLPKADAVMPKQIAVK